MKTISIEIHGGSFADGFTAYLRDEKNGYLNLNGTPCRLPPSQTVPSLYEEWRQSYQSLGFYLNPKGRVGSQADVGNLLPQCREAAKKFRNTFTDWLNSEDSGLQRLREGLLRVLGNSAESQEEVRIFLRTQDLLLQKLPWHEWDLWKKYDNTEIVLGRLECGNVNPYATYNSTGKIRILAILGKDDGINTKNDLKSLKKSFQKNRNVEIVSLSKPTQEQLNAELWEKTWDIFFFTGHGTPGQLAINNDPDSSDFDDFEYGFDKAIKKGLQLAIFNSCDGLELANQLVTELGIPQVIAMRELVPNLVAQRFLKYFLENLVDGKTVGFALREAQKRLTGDGFEKKFPGATWLPVVCQHPAKPSFSCKDRMSVTAEKSYLLIALKERLKGSAKYNVKAWLFKEETVQNLLGDEGNGITLERVPTLVVKLLGDLLHLGHSPTIEFLLPTDLLNHPVEEWRPSNNTLPIGVNHWVTIRSWERLEEEYNREQLRQHWQKTVSRKFDKRVVAYNNSNFTSCLEKRFIFFSFNTTPELEKLVPACVPMAMWIRCETSKESYEKLLCKLENCRLEEVPEIVRKERVISWDNCSHLGHISLFWDDPNRLPPKERDPEYELEAP
jgi:hypothetical protein